jgi:hypothetical protein
MLRLITLLSVCGVRPDDSIERYFWHLNLLGIRQINPNSSFYILLLFSLKLACLSLIGQ